MSASGKTAVVITAANHRHGGKPVARGTRIETDAATARWLVENKLASYADTPTEAPKKENK